MPSSPNYVRDYQQEASTESPARKRQRLMRIRARRKFAEKRGGSLPKGYDVDHIKPLSKGGSNSAGNLRLRKASRNRSYRRTSSGAMA